MIAALRGRRLRQVLTAEDFITIIIVTRGKIFRVRQAVGVRWELEARDRHPYRDRPLPQGV